MKQSFFGWCRSLAELVRPQPQRKRPPFVRLLVERLEQRDAPAVGIHITDVPAYGVGGILHGQVTGVDPAQFRVATYIDIEGLGWYTKPFFTDRTVPINADGSFSVDVATGGPNSLDSRAMIYATALVPANVEPPLANAGRSIPATLNPIAIDFVERYGRTIEFAGHTWGVKEAAIPVGPDLNTGGNRFSSLTSDVFVDANGLHLGVSFHDNAWWATEVILLDTLGYGTYTFQTNSHVETLDPNITFAAYTYDVYGDGDYEVGADPNREIDFEDGRWGNANDPTNAQEVVQPYTTVGNLHRYTIPDLGNNPALTRSFRWEPDQIQFTAAQGFHSAIDISSASPFEQFTYEHDPLIGHYVPQAGREHFRFNVWINSGGAPANNLPASVVISNFTFDPMDIADNFDRVDVLLTETSEPWKSFGGPTFNVSGNHVVANAPGTLALFENYAPAHPAVQADVTLTPNQYGGVVARYQGNDSYYLGVVQADANATHAASYIFRFDKSTGFTQLNLAVSMVAYTANTPYTLRFEVVGSSLKLLFGPNASSLAQVAFASDSMLPNAGLTGIRTSSAILDNFSVSFVAPPALPFTEAFTEPTGTPLSEQWTKRQGNFAVSNNALVALAAGANLATFDSPALADVSVQADVAALTANQFIGLIGRYQVNGNYYVGVIQADAAGANFSAYIFKFITGSGFIQLAATGPFSGIGAGTLRFNVAGTSLKLYFGPDIDHLTQIAAATDTDVAAIGLAGMRASQNATVDKFTLKAIAPPALPFTDPFTQPANTHLAHEWTQQLGDFKVVNSAIIGNAASPSIATLDGIFLADASVQANIAPAANQGTGLIARYQSDGSYYLGMIQTNAAGTMFNAYLFKFVTGMGFIPLNSTGLMPLPGPGVLRFNVAGSALKLYFGLDANNWTPLVTATDTSFSDGRVGFRLSQNATMDNVTLAAASTLAQPFVDNFPQGNPALLSDKWTIPLGAFAVANGAAAGAGPAAGPPSIATLDGIYAANVSVQADVTAGANRGVGLIARYQANGSYYLGMVQADAAGANYDAYIFEFVTGLGFVQLNTTVPRFAASGGTLRFEVVGPSLKLYFGTGGAPTLRTFAFNTDLVSGQAGMRAGMNATLDAFTLASIAPSAPTVPFIDPFNANPPTQQLSANWQEQTGNFNVQTGQAVGQSAASSNLALFNGDAAENVAVEATVAFTATGQSAGLVARYQGTGEANMYLANLQFLGNGMVRPELYARLNGAWNLLATGADRSLSAPNSVAGQLRFVVSGTTLQLFVNGVMAANANDGRITGLGLAGIRGQAGASFDDFNYSSHFVAQLTDSNGTHEFRLIQNGFHFATVLQTPQGGIAIRPHPENNPDSFGSTYYLAPYLGGGDTVGGQVNVVDNFGAFTISANGAVNRNSTSTYGTWNETLVMTYDASLQQVHATGTLLVTLNGTLAAANADLNLGRAASNFLQDVPLQPLQSQPYLRGNTGDMDFVAISYGPNDPRNRDWNPDIDPNGFYPGETTHNLTLTILGQTNHVDTDRLGAGFDINIARKPTIEISIQNSANTPNPPSLYAGMAYTIDKSKLFYEDNIEVTPQLRAIEGNLRTNLTFDITLNSTVPA